MRYLHFNYCLRALLLCYVSTSPELRLYCVVLLAKARCCIETFCLSSFTVPTRKQNCYRSVCIYCSRKKRNSHRYVDMLADARWHLKPAKNTPKCRQFKSRALTASDKALPSTRPLCPAMMAAMTRPISLGELAPRSATVFSMRAVSSSALRAVGR